jgi:hypothetical protein
MKKSNQVQGEGNYKAAEEYEKVDAAARDAKPKSKADAEEMQRAEEAGRSRAKEEDPAVKRGGGGSGSRKP